MPTYATPGVYYEALDRGRGRISPARVDVCGFVGVCAQGPLDTPVHLTTWVQYRSVFGTFRPVGVLAYAVKGFFENGGRDCYVVRVVVPTMDGLVLAPGVTQPADRRSSVLVDVGAVAVGGVVTVTQAEVVHSYLAVAVDPATGAVTWDRPLSEEYDLTSTPLPALATGSGSAATTVPDRDGDPCLVVSASSPGAWGDGVRVTTGRTAGAGTVTTSAPQPSSRLYSLVASVAGFDIGTLVVVSQAGTPALVSRRLVTAVDAVQGLLGWDAALDSALDLTRPVALETEAFTLGVVVEGTTREVFTGLSLRPEHPRFAPDVIATQSAVVRARLAAAAPGPYVLPDPTAGKRLRGGRDGMAGLRVADVLGDPSDPVRRGLRAYELVPAPALLAMPDLVAGPTPATAYAPVPAPPPDPCLPAPAGVDSAPPTVDPVLTEGWAGFGTEEVYAAQARLVEVCEPDRIALLDPPRPRTPGGGLDVPALIAWRQRFDSAYAALYAPWVQVLNPLALTGPSGNRLRAVPPSGHVAGVISRVDRTRGAGEAPANQTLAWAYELDAGPTPEEQGVLNPAGVNCLRAFDGRGLRVYGARTLSEEGLLRFLNVRRLLLAIRRTLDAELQWAAFERADLELRAMLSTAITGHLLTLWRSGALAGASPEEAFYVRADDELNPTEDAGNGQVLVEVGVAPVVPAEFVALRVGRTEAGLELEEA
jgi:phage tail sheath protein FI